MPSPQCPICYELFVGWKEVAACPCGHTFHYHCILRWSEDSKKARKRPECPTCKAPVDCEKTAKCLVPKLFFSFDGEEAENEWAKGETSSSTATDSEAFTKLRDELTAKNALTYTLQNKVTALERDGKGWEAKLTNEQLKREKTENDFRDEKMKREVTRRQMEGYKLQAGDVQKVHAENEAMKRKLEECKTIEKVLKESTNQVEAELSVHGRSAEELAKYLIILKREMERHIGEKRKLKDEAKRASEENFKYENELERLRRENELKKEKLEELRKDNAALIKRIQASQSPQVTQRRQPLSATENGSLKTGHRHHCTASTSTSPLRDESPVVKRRRGNDETGSPLNASNASMDLFSSPNDLPPSPGLILTPVLPSKPSSRQPLNPTPSSEKDFNRSFLEEYRIPRKEDYESPSVTIARETGVKYTKTKTDFEAISKKALESVVTPESVVPVKRPVAGGSGLLARVSVSVRTGYNATGGTSKFLDTRCSSMGVGASASCGGGMPRVASLGSNFFKPSKSPSVGISKFQKNFLEQQKKNKFMKLQPQVSNFFDK